MQYFLLLLCFSAFSIICSIPFFNEGNDRDPYITLGSEDQIEKDPTLFQSDSLLAVVSSPSPLNSNNINSADDEGQNVPVLDSSIFLAGNPTNKDTAKQDCNRNKDIEHKIACYAAWLFSNGTYSVSA